MSGVDDLVTWLRAQLDDDEQLARAAERYWHGVRIESATESEEDHARRWHPARVLAEIDAKRRVLDQLEVWLRGHDAEQAHEFPGTTGGVAALLSAVRTIALPYSNHPGYRNEWRP